MLLALFIICQMTVLTASNPFHKYPFVFLLDVGNEELEKTNTEQIRISVPGGSLALRYPAIGDGDTIGHVRVSGIDFGTELKANIVDGGPGYKYVVLVFMGNSGVSYDAVVTIQTVPYDKSLNYNNPVSEAVDMSENSNSYQVAEEDDSQDDPNNSAEDTNDFSENQSTNQKVNAELMQSSSNIYSYAQNQVIDDDSDDDDSGDDDSGDDDSDDGDSGDDKDDNDDDNSNVKDIHVQYSENSEQSYSQNSEVKDYIDGGDDAQEDNYNDDRIKSIDNPKAEKYSVSNGYIMDDDYGNKDNDESIGIVDSNLYGKYKALKPHFNDDVKIYTQEAFHDAQEQSSKSIVGPEDPAEIDQMFNDEEIHNDAEKYKDNNNNYFDSDDSSAVAY